MAQIDPQEFGRMQAEIQGLRRDNDRQLEIMERMEERLMGIETRLSEARGGWKTLMLVGGAAATMGGFVAWMLHLIFPKFPG